MIKEQIFVNNGALYKEVKVYEKPIKDPYIHIEDSDPLCPFYKVVNNVKKTYGSTKALRDFLGVTTSYPEVDVTGIDIAPAINFVAAVGTYENTDNKELFFRVENKDQLVTISEYYQLSYPLSEEQTKTLENSPETIATCWNDKEDLVLGSVKFTSGKPTLLKVYFMHKHHGKWEMVNRGRVFCEKKTIEEGGWFHDRAKGSKYESKGQDFTVKYVRGSNPQEPLANWEGHITNTKTGETKIKYFESSRMVRLAVCSFTIGSDYPEYDKAPEVKWWLGRSYIENEEEELYFHIESKEMLDKVCSYYDLPVPYNLELERVLTNNIRSIRFKSYDLLKLGEGNFVEVVVGSVVFVDEKPVAVRLYETKRPNE